MHEITLVSPFPDGEGGWGDRGQKSKLRWGREATKQVRPPPGTAAARSAANQPGTPPPGEWFAPAPGAVWVQPGDARGEAPCMK